MSRVIEDLKAVRALLENGHWIQGEFTQVKENGTCYCLDGAIRRATEGRYTFRYALRQALGFNNAASLFLFNDDEARTEEEILATIDAAIMRLEVQHAEEQAA